MHLKYLYPSGLCAGTTKKGTQCGARDIFQNGYCRHHGGEGKLLRDIRNAERLKLKIDRALKKSKRLDRTINRMMKENPRLREIIERINARRAGEALPTLPTLPKLTNGGPTQKA